MAESKSDKQLYVILGLYEKLYQEKYGSKPKYNKYREKWAVKDVIDSVGYDRAVTLMDYYFKVTKSGHPLQWFFYNFDKLDDMLEKIEQDSERRKFLREQTRKMVEEDERRSSIN